MIETNNKIIDLTDNIEVQNILEVDKTAENSNISEAAVSCDDNKTVVSIKNNAENAVIDLTDNPDSYEVQNILKTAENSNISMARIPSDDKQTAVFVNNDNIQFKNDINKDTSISEDIRSSDGKETAVSLNNNTNKTANIDEISNPNSNNVQDSQNIPKIGETTENSNIITKDIIASEGKQAVVSINNNANHTTIDNRHNPNCNKLLNPQNKSDIVTNITTENINDELALTNNNKEATTTECIREFEEILANVENELTLDSEITLDDIDDLIIDFNFDSYDEHISDTESQIPIHIVRKNVEKHIHTDFADFTYDKKVQSVDPNKPIKYPVEINKKNTERDAKINTTADINVNITTKNYDSIVTDMNMNTNANDSNTKPDIIINTNNANTATSNTTEDYDTISLSSDENTNKIDSICISDSSDSDCGYHSSDFEFITEEEAKREGLIINFRPDNLKNKELNAKPDSRQPKIKKISSKGKNVQAGPSKTLKVPTSGKNDQAGSIISVQRPLHIQAILSNPVKMHSIVQAGPSNPAQRPLNIEARSSNPAQRPSNVQAGSSNIFQRPSNVQGPKNSVQRPSNVPEPRNPFERPSNVQAGPSNPIPITSNVQAGPSNPIQRPLNVQAGPSNPDQMPSNVQAGPSNPVQMPSDVQAGSSNSVQRPLNIEPGPSNPVQRPSHVQAGPSNRNPVQMPSIVQAEPSNLAQRPLNIEAGPRNSVQRPSNYESYRNKYKKPFKYDTAYRNNHIEPQGDGFIDMFRGFHAGLYPMYTRENKSVTPNLANPRMWYQGVGFDMHMMGENSSDEDDELKDEANQTLQKIRSEYPVENRKRRRH